MRDRTEEEEATRITIMPRMQRGEHVVEAKRAGRKRVVDVIKAGRQSMLMSLMSDSPQVMTPVQWSN